MSSSSAEPSIVNVVSAGRFSAFDLARELERAGALGLLYTTFPRFKVRPHYPGTRFKSFPYAAAPYWLASRLGWERIEAYLGWVATESFDRWAARNLAPCSIVHALSSWCLYSGMAGRERYGALVVCDRGSAHLRFEDSILREEAARLDVQRDASDPRILEKHDAECRLADIILVPSEFARRSFIANGVDGGKIRVVPLAVDLGLFKPVSTSDDKFRIIFAGRVGIGKGIVYLLQALQRMRGDDIELLVFGDARGFERALRPFDMSRVKWRGTVTQRVLAEEMAHGSVFVLPSLSDGFGMVVAQAMACGLPVIVSENTGAADIVTDGINGFVVPIRDSEAIFERLQRLYSCPEARVEMGRAAYAAATGFGGWGEYARKILNVYSDAMRRREARDDES